MQLALFDSHCHFDFDAFDGQRESLWQDCREAGLQGLVIPSVEPARCHSLFHQVESFPGVYGSVGLHPWWVADWLSAGNQPSQINAQLSPFLSQPRCVAVGECGLDGMIDTRIAQQQALFEQQLSLASDCKLPVIVHVRKAHNEVLQTLKHFSLPKGGVIHGFSGSAELALSYWRMGFYLGIGGTITYPRASKTREAVKALPLEAMVLETDAPDMPLSGRQGEPNSPLYLPEIAQTLAELRGQSIADIAAQTTENSHRLFNIG